MKKDNTKSLLKIKCPCGRLDCILRTRKVFENYVNKKEIYDLTESEICSCKKCIKKKYQSRHLEITVSLRRPILNFNKVKYTCCLIKHILNDINYCNQLQKENDVFYKEITDIEELRNKHTETHIKLKSLVATVLKQKKDLENVIEKYKVSENELHNENRILKKRLKMMEKEMSNMVFDNTLQIDTSDEDEEEVKEVEVKIVEVIKVVKEVKLEDKLNTIYKYQQIVNYLTPKKLSLSKVLYNILPREQVESFRDKFYRLKYQRLSLCHPSVIDIQNDIEFVNILK